MEYRVESDSMGEMKVPANAYYAAQTARAIENFPVSGIRFPRRFIRAMGLIKRAAAEVNMELGLLDKKVGDAIVKAATEVVDGKLDDHFPLDIFQTGSGTSTNMNTNEVIANRAAELLGGKIGDKKLCHPNDHVNKSQSSNDVIPTAMHVAAVEGIDRDLLPALRHLAAALSEKAKAWDNIVKIGRTHLMDATPIRLGQEFSGYASMIEHGVRRVETARQSLGELALGGTAVGTGINMPLGYAAKVCAKLARDTGGPLREAENHFEAQGAQDAVVEASGVLKTVACSLMKIANDIRLMGSGPRCGIFELELPALQPGSSIMPGKVNPVIPESVTMVCAQVIGNDAAITIGGQGGHFELNVMLPVMARNLLESIHILANVSRLLADRCVKGLKANRERAEGLIEQSLMMVTSLAPAIGYDNAAKIAKEAFATGKTVRELVKSKKLLDDAKLNEVLDPRRMTEPGVTGAEGGG